MHDLVPAEGAILDEILDATHTIWSEGLTRAAYGRHYEAQRQTPWGRAHLERLALIGRSTTGSHATNTNLARSGDVLASTKIYALNGMLDGTRVRIAGIGAVFTQPSHRGSGHARELIERVLARAAATADLALLFSEIGPDYYARLGFRAVPTSQLVLGLKTPPRPGAPMMMVRAGDERDLAAIETMGRERAAAFRFHLDRDHDLIQYSLAKKRLLAGLDTSGTRQVHFFVAEEGGSTAAYVVLSVTRQGGNASAVWTLEECGDRDPSGARVGAILQALVAREPAAARTPTIRGSLPSGFLPPQLTIIEGRPAPAVMMVRGLKIPTPTLTGHDVLYWDADVF